MVVSSVAYWKTNFSLPETGKNYNNTFDNSHSYAQATQLNNQKTHQYLDYQNYISFEMNAVSPARIMESSLSKTLGSSSKFFKILLKRKLHIMFITSAYFNNNIYVAKINEYVITNAILKFLNIT